MSTLYDGTGSNGLAVVWDSRSKNCADSEWVMREWPLGKRALGRTEWARTLKVALREHGTDPWTARDLKAAKDAIIRELLDRGIRCVVPVQTAAIANIRQVHSAWNLFGHNGSPYKWAGTVERIGEQYVMPLLNPANYEFVYGWLLERWLRQAKAIASGNLVPMPWPELNYMPSADMLAILERMYADPAPLAIDIETNMAGTLISAIGFSNQHGTVSVPWEAYEISGTNGQREAAIHDYSQGAQIARIVLKILEDAKIPKILHNGAFDVYQLGRKGITLRGFDHDTLLMHRVCYPQYRHGLQQSCATEFAVEPWKCLFKPPRLKTGEDVWLGCPVELRRYNCKDTYATWQLWNHLKGKLG